jgi:hypothetical protein
MASFFGVHDKLQKVYDETDLKFNMDSPFSASKYEFITKSLQNFDQCHFNDMQTMATNSAATSVRQAAEWGMAALHGLFPRLTDTFPYEDGPGERLETLKMVMLLYNFQCKYSKLV